MSCRFHYFTERAANLHKPAEAVGGNEWLIELCNVLCNMWLLINLWFGAEFPNSRDLKIGRYMLMKPKQKGNNVTVDQSFIISTPDVKRFCHIGIHLISL